MREAIQSLILKGAVTVVDTDPQQFISTLFLVEKGQRTGVFLPVINLKALNRFLPKEKFKMEGLHTVGSLLRRGDYMMKLDLQHAYFAVPIFQAPVVQRVDNFTQRISCYPADLMYSNQRFWQAFSHNPILELDKRFCFIHKLQGSRAILAHILSTA